MRGEQKLKFAEPKKEPQGPAIPERPPWKVLIVDDELSIHEITRHVLKNLTFEDRGLEFLSAMSGAEAKEQMKINSDIAVVLLDAVMETDNAGLELADYIRNELDNEVIRIILRTGQAGQIPERQVIQDYDINDYREKSDLSATRLFTSVIVSLRNYSLLTRLERCLNGMEAVIEAIRHLLKFRSYSLFSEGLLEQVLALLNLDESGLYIDVSGCALEKEEQKYTILAGTGEFADPAYREGTRSLPDDITGLIDHAISSSRHHYTDDEFIGYIPSEINDSTRILYLRGIRGLDARKRHVIETFLTNISVGFDTIAELERLQGNRD